MSDGQPKALGQIGQLLMWIAGSPFGSTTRSSPKGCLKNHCAGRCEVHSISKSLSSQSTAQTLPAPDFAKALAPMKLRLLNVIVGCDFGLVIMVNESVRYIPIYRKYKKPTALVGIYLICQKFIFDLAFGMLMQSFELETETMIVVTTIIGWIVLISWQALHLNAG